MTGNLHPKRKHLYGVLQESIVGPLFPPIYIYIYICIYIWPCQNTNSFFTLMFADDTSIFLSGNDLSMMEKHLMMKWKMWIHGWRWIKYFWIRIKTHFMLLKATGLHIISPRISIDDKYIKQVNCTKFIVNYDSWWINLETSYKIQIKKIARGIGKLWKIYPIVNQ